MRNLVLLAAAAAISAPAFAQDTGGTVLSEYGTYNSFGQCNAALAHVRNDQRKNPSTRGTGYQDLSGSAFNQASLTTTRCEETSAGSYQIVFYADGFPDGDSGD